MDVPADGGHEDLHVSFELLVPSELNISPLPLDRNDVGRDMSRSSLKLRSCCRPPREPRTSRRDTYLLDVHRVPADQSSRNLPDTPLDGFRVPLEGPFSPPHDPSHRLDTDKQPSGPDLKRLNVFDCMRVLFVAGPTGGGVGDDWGGAFDALGVRAFVR